MITDTKTLPIDQPEAISLAAEIINDGGVIAFPTDTVYGIGASAFNEKAIERLYHIKERSKEKAIPVLISDPGELALISPAKGLRLEQVIDQFWPGALTIILPLSPDLPANLSSTKTIGIRVPNHSLTRDLLRVSGPLAATSANLSGEESALTAEDVSRNLEGKIDLILDGGRTPGGVASSVLDLSGAEAMILREGPITMEDLKPFLNSE